jgi:hypothetical protein
MYRFLVLALVFAGASAQAASFGFSANGTDSNGNPVGASVIFNILDAHDFTATLSDTEGSILDFQQLIEGLKFGFAGTGLLLVGSNGERVMISSNGAVTVLGTGSTDWGTGISGGDWLLCATCGGGQGADITGSDPSISGTFLSGNVTFTFTTASSLPTDGTDPFGNVSFMFLSGGDLVLIPAPVGTLFTPNRNQSTDGPQGYSANQQLGTNGQAIGGPFTPGTSGASGTMGSGGNSGTTGWGDSGTTASSNFSITNFSDPGTAGFGASGASGGNSGGPPSDPPINFSTMLDPPAVPEPATLPLTGAVLLGFAFCRKRSGGNR